jgi:hypothetical protein
MDMISPHASLVQRVIVGSAPYVPPSVAVHRRPAGTAAAAGGAAPGSTGARPDPRASSVRGSRPKPSTPLPASEGGASHDPPDAGVASRLARGGLDRGDSLGALGGAASTGSVVAVDVANARGSGTIGPGAGASAGAALVARARIHPRARVSS